MDQSSDNSNKPESSPDRFDYSGLIPPESMGGSNASPAPELVNKPQNPAPNPAPASSAPPPPTPPPPVPTPEPPKNDSLTFPNQSQADDLDLDAPEQTSGAPGSMPHHSSCGSWLLVIVLTILLALAILVFLSWKGLVSINVLDRFWGTSSTPTPAASETLTPAPGSNDATRKQNLASVAQALKKYYADNVKYPVSAVVVKTSDSQSVLAQALVPAYITALPDDPLTPAYYYGYKSDGKTFELSAVLEDKTDVSGTLQGSLNIYKVTDVTGQ